MPLTKKQVEEILGRLPKIKRLSIQKGTNYFEQAIGYNNCLDEVITAIKGMDGEGMKCDYCGRCVKDMPNHLNTKPKCSQEHANKLKSQLKEILDNHARLVKFFKEKKEP